MRVTKTTMFGRPDTLTLATLRDIHSRLNGIIGDFADYGLLPADLNSMTDALIARPRTLIVEGNGINQDMILGL